MDRYRCAMPEVKVFMGVGATIDYEADAVVRAPRWMTRNGLEWLYRHHHRAEALLAALSARHGILLARPARRPRPAIVRAALCDEGRRPDDQDRHGRAGQDGVVASRDRARPSRHRPRRRLRRHRLSDRHPEQVRRAQVLRRLRPHARRASSSTRSSSRRRRSCMRRWSRRRWTRGLHVFCEKPFVLDVADGERLVALAESKALGQPGRLPLPLRRRVQGSRAHRQVGRARHRPPCAGRGLRAGRAAPQGQHLAFGQERGRRRPVRLRLSRDRPGQFHRRRPRVGRRRRAQQRLLARRRRRGLLHACTSPTAPAASSA